MHSSPHSFLFRAREERLALFAVADDHEVRVFGKERRAIDWAGVVLVRMQLSHQADPACAFRHLRIEAAQFFTSIMFREEEGRNDAVPDEVDFATEEWHFSRPFEGVVGN